MKLMFASDIHGSSYFCRKMLEMWKKEKAGRLILLGDLLYHGPRNELPKEYAPKEVISLLNSMKNEICAVRGNCEAEVDQMVLDFPVMADYCIIVEGERTIYATHGPRAERREGYVLLNPGSVSIPKEGNPPTYGILEGGSFCVKDFDGNIIKEINI